MYDTHARFGIFFALNLECNRSYVLKIIIISNNIIDAVMTRFFIYMYNVLDSNYEFNTINFKIFVDILEISVLNC